ncbi:potassium channel family protein [Smaragdicoccus niigatensis]|uniref:potassium channel family protein n=1 Tax=Smaragdicoccus niigatensis TaxID=359359 RepID=UPI00037EF4CA|nr:potassium channel family protein [Smaragdicoccus niigatensis]
MTSTEPRAAAATERWHQRMDWPLTVSSTMFLIAYAWSVLARPGPFWQLAADLVMWTTWAYFAIDYLMRLATAKNRVHWFFVHIIDFLIVALPLLRPLKLLRIAAIVVAVQRTLGSAMRGRVVWYAAGGTAFLVFVSAVAVLDAERHSADAHITTFADALWWATATVTTVGYGDFSPVTAQGRLVAVGLMVAGIALLGVVTATVASWLLEQVTAREERFEAATQAEVGELTVQIEALRSEIAELRASSDNRSSSVP